MNQEKFIFQNVLNDISNQKLEAETAAVVLSSEQFQNTRDNSVVISGCCCCSHDEKIDVCFHNGDAIHIGSNLKSICFSESFDVVIEKYQCNAVSKYMDVLSGVKTLTC